MRAKKGAIRMQMKREDYKAVKHMDKQALTAYLQRLYRRGYEAGVRAMAAEMKKDPQAEPADSGGAES